MKYFFLIIFFTIITSCDNKPAKLSQKEKDIIELIDMACSKSFEYVTGIKIGKDFEAKCGGLNIKSQVVGQRSIVAHPAVYIQDDVQLTLETKKNKFTYKGNRYSIDKSLRKWHNHHIQKSSQGQLNKLKKELSN